MPDNELQLRIRAIADLKDAEKARAALADLHKELQQGGKAAAPSGITASFKAMKQEFADAGGGLKGFLTVLTGSGASIAAWASGVAGAFALAAKGLHVFMDKQVQVAKLDAVLANQGKLTDEYRVKLQALASTLAGATATSSNDWLQALTTLNKFGANTGNIDQYAEAVKNLAGMMEGGIPEAAFIFGKAMQGQHHMLTRYGIEVDSTKSRTEQLAQIMQQAAERGGGVMESRAHTIAGAFDLFNGSLKKTLGGLGNIVAQSGLVQAGLAAMTGVLNAVASVLPKTVPPVEGLTNSLTALSPAAKEAAERVAELSHAQIGEGVQQQAEGATRALGAEVDALRRLQDQLDQTADAELKGNLAKIDEAEAKVKSQGGLTASAKEGFEQQRRAARRDFEAGKARREEANAAIALDVAQGDAYSATQALEAHRNAVNPQLDALRANRDKLRNDSNIEGLGGYVPARAFLEKEIADIKTELGGTIVRDQTRQTGILPGRLADELEARTQQLNALKGLPAAEQAYDKAKGQADARETELTNKQVEAAKRLDEAGNRLALAAKSLETLATQGRAGALDDRTAARSAQLKDAANRLESMAADQDAIVNSTDTNVTEAQRAQAKAAAARFRDAGKFYTAQATEDPYQRNAATAALPATAQNAAEGLRLDADPNVRRIGEQAVRALQIQGQATVRAFEAVIQQATQNGRDMAAAVSRANANRP